MKTHCRLSSISCAATFLLVLAMCAAAEEGDTLWTRTYGGPGDDGAQAIVPSGDGNFLVAGYKGGDAYLVKINHSGDSIWAYSYGSAGSQGINSIVSSGDGGWLLAGYSRTFLPDRSDMFLMKVDSAGDFVWSHNYDRDSSDYAYSIISSGDGGFLLAGETGYIDTYGEGDYDVWLVKVDAAGTYLWSQTYGEGHIDYAGSIIASGNGTFLLAGVSWVPYGTGWQQDMLLVQVDSSGALFGYYTYGDSLKYEEASTIISTEDGGFLLAGAGTGEESVDMLVVKIDSNYNFISSHVYGGPAYDFAYSIISLGDAFWLAGETQYEVAGPTDMYLVKIDSAFDTLLARAYGGDNWDRALSVIPSEDGNLLLAGSYYWGEQGDMYVVKVEGPGTAVDPEASTIHPSSFTLHPPHPNPFNPTTVLRFQLPVASFVTLEVFDVNGRFVGAQHAAPLQGVGFGESDLRYFTAGTHQITFDGSGLPSGIYLARLTAGDWSVVQKLVLLK